MKKGGIGVQDNDIIALYFARNEKAIEATQEKYGGYCDLAHDSKGRIYVLWETNFGTMVSLSRFEYNDIFGD